MSKNELRRLNNSQKIKNLKVKIDYCPFFGVKQIRGRKDGRNKAVSDFGAIGRRRIIRAYDIVSLHSAIFHRLHKINYF